jgi:hypothetical protein
MLLGAVIASQIANDVLSRVDDDRWRLRIDAIDLRVCSVGPPRRVDSFSWSSFIVLVGYSTVCSHFFSYLVATSTIHLKYWTIVRVSTACHSALRLPQWNCSPSGWLGWSWTRWPEFFAGTEIGVRKGNEMTFLGLRCSFSRLQYFDVYQFLSRRQS